MVLTTTANNPNIAVKAHSEKALLYPSVIFLHPLRAIFKPFQRTNPPMESGQILQKQPKIPVKYPCRVEKNSL